MRDEAVGLGNGGAAFVIKDSGKRAEFSGGMVRDIADDKIDYTLITDGPMFKRWAVHLTNGAKKYAKRNWMKAEGDVEMARFKESAFRHFMQWYYGEVDEDHASAVYFNINGFEYVKGKTGDNPR
jgi:dATP/dGTP diphosphohydrolase